MKRISTADLREREVINLCGGEKLGYICDFEIDADCGKILALIVSSNNFSLFGKRDECVIPWCNVECIGEDTVLVKIAKSELSCSDIRRTQKKH